MVRQRPPYTACVYLCIIAADRWSELAAAYFFPGHSLLREPLHQFLNLVYSWCIERVEPAKLDDWKAGLLELLPWQDADSDAAEAIESDSFMNMKAKGGG